MKKVAHELSHGAPKSRRRGDGHLLGFLGEVQEGQEGCHRGYSLAMAQLRKSGTDRESFPFGNTLLYSVPRFIVPPVSVPDIPLGILTLLTLVAARMTTLWLNMTTSG